MKTTLAILVSLAFLPSAHAQSKYKTLRSAFSVSSVPINGENLSGAFLGACYLAGSDSPITTLAVTTGNKYDGPLFSAERKMFFVEVPSAASAYPDLLKEKIHDFWITNAKFISDIRIDLTTAVSENSRAFISYQLRKNSDGLLYGFQSSSESTDFCYFWKKLF